MFPVPHAGNGSRDTCFLFFKQWETCKCRDALEQYKGLVHSVPACRPCTFTQDTIYSVHQQKQCFHREKTKFLVLTDRFASFFMFLNISIEVLMVSYFHTTESILGGLWWEWNSQWRVYPTQCAPKPASTPGRMNCVARGRGD
jgi:hypothetical protein